MPHGCVRPGRRVRAAGLEVGRFYRRDALADGIILDSNYRIIHGWNSRDLCAALWKDVWATTGFC